YTHLPGDDDPVEGGGKFGMKKLKTPAFGAFRFLNWLKQADQSWRLVKPLASYEIILAPSAKERAIPGLPEGADDASTGNVIARIREWRKRVAADRDNAAVFYFTGHGIQRNKEDAVLMLQDFAESEDAMLEKSISFYDIFSGMAPSNKLPDMGLTQLYFVDACRNLPEQIKDFATLNATPVFDAGLSGASIRQAAVVFGAVSARRAFAEVEKGSYFIQALIAATERGADFSRLVDGKKRWPVSIFPLTPAIRIEFGKFNT